MDPRLSVLMSPQWVQGIENEHCFACETQSWGFSTISPLYKWIERSGTAGAEETVASDGSVGRSCRPLYLVMRVHVLQYAAGVSGAIWDTEENVGSVRERFLM